MQEEKDLEEIYSKSVSEIGKGLFSEFLSDESRKRQTNLLISSIIAILLSSTLITPTQISIGVITTESLNSQLFIFLSGLTCIYFVSIYILSVMQDLEVYKYRKMPLTFIWHDLYKKINNADKDSLEEMKKAYTLIEERMIKRIALSEIREELVSELRKNTDEFKDLNFAPTKNHVLPKKIAIFKGIIKEFINKLEIKRRYDIKKSGFTPLHRPIPHGDQTVQKNFAEINKVRKELYQTEKQDGVDEVLKQQKELMQKRHDLFSKELLLLNMNEKYDRLNKIKMFIEIGFPLLLGIGGIGSTIFALLK